MAREITIGSKVEIFSGTPRVYGTVAGVATWWDGDSCDAALVRGYLVRLQPGACGYVKRQDGAPVSSYITVVAVAPGGLCAVEPPVGWDKIEGGREA